MAETAYIPDPRPVPPVLLPSGRRGGAILYRYVSVTGVAQRVVNFDPNRMAAILLGDAAGTIFLNRLPSVSTASSFAMLCVAAGGAGPMAVPPMQVDGCDEIWAITSGSPVGLCIMEVRFR